MRFTPRFFVALFVFYQSVTHLAAAERFGGVEIGAKGVKVSAVEVDTRGETPSLKVLELDKKTVDVTISRLKGKKFDSGLVEDTALVVKDFIAALMTELQVPEENIQVVASSGVPFADNIAELTTAIEEQTKKELSRIDAIEEATLTAIALVPHELRTKVLIVDVGSGNTKGGAFLDESGAFDQFITLEVPYGAQTLSKAIDGKLAETTGGSRIAVTREVSEELVGQKIQQQIEANPVLGEREQILFAGGSVWACVTIMKPGSALDPFPSLTAGEIKAYVALINKNSGKYPEVDFTKVTDEAARASAQKDYDRIRGATDKPIFRPEELQAGAALLEQISLSLHFEERQVRFDRKAMTAWITARITPEDLRHLLPVALGRKIEFSDEHRAEIPQKESVRRYGGVEIGAKGVKVSAVEVDARGETPSLKVLELDKKTVDVTISRLKGKKFDSGLVEDTALVVKDFIAALMTELQVPEENIQVVASSGVPFADNIAELTTAIEEQTKKELSRIDAIEEATLTAIALVPHELRTKVLIVDVGSGNTKGGAFLDESGAFDQFITLEVPYGAQTLSKAIDGKLAETTGGSRIAVSREVSAELVGQKIQQQIEANPVLGEREQILFAGGSVWACVTIMKPGSALDPFPSLTAAEIKAYVALINKNSGKYPDVDFTKVTDQAARASAQKDYDRIRGVTDKPTFRPEELQAGAALLEQISLSLHFEERQVRFDRKAMTAWITARITPEELRHLLPVALGRKLEFELSVSTTVPPKKTENAPGSIPGNVNLPRPKPNPPESRPTVTPSVIERSPVTTPIQVAIAPAGEASEAVVPTGLTMPPGELLRRLSFLAPQSNGDGELFTPQFCMDVAVKCYQKGYYADSLALTKHGNRYHPHPSTLYLQALNEIALSKDHEAAQTARRLRSAGGSSRSVIGPLRESLNGPHTVRLVQMIDDR